MTWGLLYYEKQELLTSANLPTKNLRYRSIYD